MATLSTYFVGETKYMSSGEDRKEEDEEEEEENEENEEDKEEEKDESAVQKQQRPAWSPCLYTRADKDLYYYVGQKIIIEGVLDSYAGMVWPGFWILGDTAASTLRPFNDSLQKPAPGMVQEPQPQDPYTYLTQGPLDCPQALALCHYLDTHREQLSLMDKSVLEIGAGTGLLSVVAVLLGAWVTATDLPEVLSNLQANVMRNTRERCRYTPQLAALSWGHDLERTFPTSVYRYDYVLAADVVYHHDFLDELLVTMKHFCRPGTTVIWANKVRFETDLTFTENFKKAFHTRLLAEDGEMKIFMATCRDEAGGVDQEILEDLLTEKEEESHEKPTEEKHNDIESHDVSIEESKGKETDGRDEPHGSALERGDEEEGKPQHKSDGEEEMEETIILKDEDYEEEEKTESEEDCTGQACINTADLQHRMPAWVPSIRSSFGRDVYHYAGQDIVIQESIDSFGAVMWPAALALCSFLDNNRERVNLQGEEVLELGAGTGLVTIVASLLGASVTATDLPEVLSNLQANVMRNTRGRCRYTPQLAALSWGHDLERTFPKSVYRYDYVLAADVVYHHDFLDELLVTMKHFCRPGTTVIWANKVRFETDLTFTENFKKAFHTRLVAEDGEMKIFMATCRE